MPGRQRLVGAPGRAYRLTMGYGVLNGALGGLLAIGLVTLMLGVAVGAVLYQHEIGASLRGIVRRVLPSPEPPAGPPIERIAWDARRLRAELLVPNPGAPMARRIGVQRAYDDLLADACRALGVSDTLAGLPPGVERDAERLHVEHELDAAGLRLNA
jgi:hypothetical protein